MKRKWMYAGIGILFSVSVLAAVTVYAKYYAQSAKAGVAIASGMYFASNYLGMAPEDVFLESVVNEEYGGGNYTMVLEVRNYENNLLYNDGNMEIPYSLTLWLEDGVGLNPDIRYSVSDGQGNTYPLAQGKANAVTLSGRKLTGGQALADEYSIKLEVPMGTFNDNPPAVYAVAKTDAGSLISRTLQGRLILHKADTGNFVESSGFIFPTLPDEADDEAKLAHARKLGALTYEIRTVSEARTTVENQTKLKISWKSDKLEIDKFDTSLSNEGTDADGWNYVTVNAIPYSAIQITFFKKDNLQGITSLQELNALVRVEIISEEP